MMVGNWNHNECQIVIATMSEGIVMQNVASIVASFQGANHFGRCDGGFFSPAGFVIHRHPMSRRAAAIARLRRFSHGITMTTHYLMGNKANSK